MTFYLTKAENRTKKSLHSFHTITLSKVITFVKKCWIFEKKFWNQQNWGDLGTKKYIFSNSETTYVHVLTHQISRF